MSSNYYHVNIREVSRSRSSVENYKPYFAYFARLRCVPLFLCVIKFV